MNFNEAYALAEKGKKIRPVKSHRPWIFQGISWFSDFSIFANEALGEWEAEPIKVNFIEAAEWCNKHPNQIAWKVGCRNSSGIQYSNRSDTIVDSVGGTIDMAHIAATYEIS